MRRDTGEDVADVARRRLEQLGRELARAAPAADPAADPTTEPAAEPAAEEHSALEPCAVPEPGRHAGPRSTRLTGRPVGILASVLPPGLRGRVALRSSHLTALAVLVAVAVAGTAWWTLAAAPEPVPVPVAQVEPAPGLTPEPAPAPASGAPAPVPASGAPAAPAEVVVDIAGKVRRPGVATLPAGSRVIDAVKRAGGAHKGVDLSTLNLARVLVDGEQILVGVPPVGGAAAAIPPSATATLVNLNTATSDQLDSLPGVGPVTAQKILDWRTAHGAFTAVDELLEVDGIGAKTFAEIAPRVTL